MKVQQHISPIVHILVAPWTARDSYNSIHADAQQVRGLALSLRFTDSALFEAQSDHDSYALIQLLEPVCYKDGRI